MKRNIYIYILVVECMTISDVGVMVMFGIYFVFHFASLRFIVSKLERECLSRDVLLGQYALPSRGRGTRRTCFLTCNVRSVGQCGGSIATAYVADVPRRAQGSLSGQ